MREVVEFSLGANSVLFCFEAGRLVDSLFIGDGTEEIGAIYCAQVERPIKGLGGCFVDLGGTKAFLRSKNPPAAGRILPVQIVQHAGGGKPARVSDQVDYRGQYIVMTPNRPGVNISRKLKNNAHLDEIVATCQKLANDDFGMIIRSSATDADADTVIREATALREQLMQTATTNHIGLIHRAATGKKRAEIEWGPVQFETTKQLQDHHAEAVINQLHQPRSAGSGSVHIERTQALIAIDIDTGTHTGPMAGREVNAKSIPVICQWLRIMGWGGQLIIDTAPMPNAARQGFKEQFIKISKANHLSAVAHGFGPMGLFEARLKNDRRPLPISIIERINEGR